MNKENLTSLELSKKLHENGCKIESEYVRVDTRKSWKAQNCPIRGGYIEVTPGFEPFWNLEDDDPECEFVPNKEPFPNKGYNESKPLPAFDILNDICIKHAKEFFGRDRIDTDTDLVFKLMKMGKKQEAEGYIWRNCTFNPDSPDNRWA
ncbi:MAG: hypothetical protein GY870_05380 [archaeon]|nr:hypothetical protein [archaeon]